MRHRLVPILLTLVACVPLPACDGDPATSLEGVASGEGVTGGTDSDPTSTDDVPTQPLTEEEARALRDARAAKRDEVARELLAAHDSRVYEPTRDSGLERLSGRIVAGIGDTSFEFTLDCRIDEEGDALLDIERTNDDVMPPRDVAELVVELGRMAVKGASTVVLTRRPPIPYHSVKAPDGNYIVVAPPFQGDVQTSYRLDEMQVVVVAGHVNSRGKQVTRFEYDHSRGRSVLQRSIREGVGTETVFEHEEHSGVLLPSRISRTTGDRTVVLECSWDTIVATPPPR